MGSNLVLMKELIWDIQLDPLEDLKISSFMVHLIKFYWDDKN